ncbi:MAG TPA: NUDIX domain-containing protein [Gemmataceae bacterium]|nr:NUDIX domain-containing protein [Gemmataceae bacterium]
MPRSRAPIPQAAALAVRQGQLCLVRSSGDKRWVVPKGRLEPGRTLTQIALQEAWEEAGLVGILCREPVGAYVYRKAGGVYHVTVYLMEVTAAAEDWPESRRRRRRWVRPRKAVIRLADEGLRAIVRSVLNAA